jgi:uncharacterized protein (UPF0218 family)
MRRLLKKPLGELIDLADQNAPVEKIAKAKLVIAVGDATSRSLRSRGRSADIELIDGKEQRKEVTLEASHQRTVKVSNPAGEITIEAMNTLKRVLPAGRKLTIIIDGEEDLLTIPAALYSPLGSIVLYGQPGRGVVMLEVKPELKQRMRKLLRDLRRYQTAES